MPPMTAADARDALRLVRNLVVEVGAEVAAEAGRLRTQCSDKGDVDLVTAADQLSEERLTSALARHFPAHRIAGEEGTRLGPADSPWTWWIDPIDGTCNFSRGLPYWMISVGLAYHDQPVLGWVHGPECGLSVGGAIGVGGFSGDRELPRATPPGPERGWVVAVDWTWSLEQRQRVSTLLGRLAPRIRQYKTYGSAAVDFAHLALGLVDAYCIPSIYKWDQCGGAAAVLALGYEMRGWDGRAWDLREPSVAACRPGMWPTLSEACAP